MPVTVSYPGLYIQELPLSARSIAAAPTSITVIVGYTHPYKTRSFGEAVRLFSFSDYERHFGGMFASGLVESHVPHAANQFFLNGGSDLYVVGLEPKVTDSGTTKKLIDLAPVAELKTSATNKIVFRGQEPTDLIKMTVSINNIRAGAGGDLNTFDLTVTYGRRVESYRGLGLKADAARPLASLGGDRSLSTLVTVDDGAGGVDFGTAFSGGAKVELDLSKPDAATVAALFDATDFINAFKVNSSLDKVPVFNILLTPGIFDNTVNSEALAFSERHLAFAIIDAPQDAAADDTFDPLPEVTDFLDAMTLSENGALYFPYLRYNDPLLGQEIEIAPSGYVAGIYASTDNRRGVWKAPAGIETNLQGTTGVVARGEMNNARQGVLYGVLTGMPPVNCLRSVSGAGTVVHGARTLVGSNPAYNASKHVPVRRMTLFIEQTLLRNLTWVVFEPNDEPLWIAIRQSIEGFMMSLYNQGALQGENAGDAFLVKCDNETTTQQDIDNGIVNIVVSFRPLKPAEFVVINIAQLAGQAQTA